ncbi:ABC transporter ATP-binding protein [Flavobacteriaceae bacterium]|jgi:ABC-2 type transport system ATP-binding protein|nr:ABC transporter ATP-binding protein [Flavobacteriaceae bacterium]MDA9323719.1 ABC transporter ATP-binding protein [Flavobacteriaceae bacterium]MDB0042650.1 ABC transporter ATP-binding protein [Flavobacteriaceae bacterium]MDB4093069.1 ABC transporter ATP-binding protein [Flavobacteriaceae bacterium]MDC0007760.1 ABC transporter ATP-binding protein [Flavobacteriaceae bacterium]|tara:strand:+ start:5246 stop:5941 length:696 start_codon:yes stop_codon:yes gene_type:complete
MIKIENLTKKYSKQTVLDILSLEIPSGQTFGLIGNNGAGKTTLFSCLLDLIKPTKGKVINNDVEVSTSEDWKSFTTAFLDETFLIGYLMPEEYFYFIGELRGLSKIQVDNFVLKFEDFFHGEILGGKKYLRDLSKGNQKKVGVIAALIGEPKVIILDEPFANLDPSTQIRLKGIIKDLSKYNDTTILVSSHDIQDVTEVCDRIALLEKGKLIKDIKTNKETLKELETYFKG